jgi:phage terminase small subunit
VRKVTVGVDETLTDREELFVLEYCRSLNRARSAKAAGYSEESMYFTGSELLRKPNVLRAVEEEMQKRAKSLRLGADYIVLQIHSSMLRAAEQGDEKTVIKALELLGKYLGIFEKDNRQRAGTAELEAARNRLRERLGIDVDVTKPLELEPSKN